MATARRRWSTMPVIKQSDVFLQGEGDAWHERNKDKPRLPDPVLDAIEACKIEPKAVVELGCGTGWRLAEIQRLWHPERCLGYDTSEKAVDLRVFPNVYQEDALHVLSKKKSQRYDLIIFGFCLYLVDREDLMLIAAHADRVLKDGGHIIIHDFSDGTYRVRYKHKEEIWSYHLRYANLWLVNPAYKHIATEGDMPSPAIVLKKDMANAYPERKE